MKQLFSVVFLFATFNLFAQQDYFMFIQSENNQTFYVRLADKTYSSSSAGHLIISGLKDSVYNIAIGFPKNQYPEEDFQVAIGKKDKGFILKNMGDQGWSLFNLQTLQLLKAQKKAAAKKELYLGDVKKTDAYALLMAGVVNDSAVLYSSIAKAEVPKNDISSVSDSPKKSDVVITPPPVTPDPSSDKTNNSKAADTTSITKTQQLPPASNNNVQKISKFSELQSASGLQMVFLDKTVEGVIDTIKLMIPATVSKKAAVTTKNKTTDTLVQAGSKKQMAGNDSVVVANSASNDSAAGKLQNTSAGDSLLKVPKPVKSLNANCKNFAIESDVDKLRIKMLAEKNEDDRVTVARKIFRTKCFTTKQINALSELFTNDEGKYKLLDAAYPFVSDSENFIKLRGLLRDEYYVNRFNAMIRN